MVRRFFALVVGLLMVSIAFAGSASASISFNIYEYYNPTLAGQSVELYVDASSTCGNISDYTWHFGDGSVLSTSNSDIYHTWQNAGTYSVSLTVTDSCGASVSDGYTQTVKPDNAPVAAFSTTVADKTVYADPSATTDNDGVNNPSATPVYYFTWNWGDGSSSDSYAASSGGLASHAYAAPGNYTITLTAYDTAGNSDANSAISHSVQVGAQPGGFYEDTSPAVHYRGSWSIVSCPRVACSPNRVEHRSATAGNRARFTFTGTQVSWIATKGPLGGTAGVYLDGVFQTRIHLFRHHVRDGAYVYSSPQLNSGTHTLRIQVTHNQRVNIDIFLVQP